MESKQIKKIKNNTLDRFIILSLMEIMLIKKVVI